MGEEGRDLNWNAGTEFNNLVGYNKYLFISNNANQNVEALLQILTTDIDLTYSKILIEAKKDKDAVYEDVEKELNSIRSDAENLNVLLSKNRGKSSYIETLNQEIIKLRRRIWDLQGFFGVLFPVDRSKKSDPGQAVRNF